MLTLYDVCMITNSMSLNIDIVYTNDIFCLAKITPRVGLYILHLKTFQVGFLLVKFDLNMEFWDPKTNVFVSS